ncbi:hypothetical protein DXG01_016518 [Tephrocybe rancida]|nr:hypothetical protein DXG01_016518 [Tephrocybe rancida]
MEQTLPSAGGYSRHQQHAGNQQQHQPLLFPSAQLPSPAQLLPRLSSATNDIRYDTRQQQQAWYPNHRTSSSRDEPGHQAQSHHNINLSQQQQQSAPHITVKRESIGNLSMQAKDNASTSAANGARTSTIDDTMPSASDFVKKLYKYAAFYCAMLEDKSFQHVVSWGPQGDCFVVKDMNEFTKSILPRLFKHSNFASFVRQLNKYDFHKVKNTDDAMQFGEQSWTFRHPDFHADRREALENIKRKVPAQRKQQQAAAAAAPLTASSTSHHRSSRHHSRRHRSRSPSYSQYSRSTSPDSIQVHDLHSQIATLQSQLRAREARERELEERLRVLERGHGDISQGLANVQRGLAMQDRMVQGMVGGWVGIDGQGTEPKSQPSGLDQSRGLGSGGSSARSAASSRPLPPPAPLSVLVSSDVNAMFASRPQNQQYAPFLVTPAAAGVEKPEEVARASLMRVGEYSRQQQERRARTPSDESPQQEQEEEHTISMPPSPPQQDWTPMGMGMGAEQEALHVYTVGHLMPRAGAEGWYEGQSGWGEGSPGQQQQQQPIASTSAAVASTSDGNNLLRVRRSTFVPGWAVPPRVLIVDDDVVSRKLGSKFLQVFGCTIDVAVDGVSAVNKMNLEKYDLVLMDIVMPKLDGVSATSMIRQFDAMTPIISMTSNSKPNEIMTYYSSGMNDILPKPFTKEGLLDMLEKHLMHLKVIQQHMRSTNVPRSIGIPPLNDAGFSAAIAAGAASTSTSNNAANGLDLTNFSMTPPPFGFDAEADGRINPLTGMGLTEEQYNMILQNITGDVFLGGVNVVDGPMREKRIREDGEDVMGMGMGMSMTDGERRERKRSRFEVIE